MARVDRIVFGGLGIGLVAAALNGLRRVEPANARLASGDQARSASVVAGQADENVDADLAAFRRDLGKLRHGDESVLPSLREAAERLCNTYSRCDARDVLAFYSGLSPADRARGLEREEQADHLRNEATDARRRGLDEEDWAPLQRRIIDNLQALSAQALAEPDFVPGARALSLSAYLIAERIDSDPTLDNDQSVELGADAEKDARASISAFERAGMLTPKLEPMWVLGLLELERGDLRSASAAYEDCLALADRVRQDDWRESALCGLIDIAEEAGDIGEVSRLLNEIAAFRSPAQSWLLAKRQANFLLQRDEPRVAIEFLTSNRPSDPIARRQWHLLLGNTWMRARKLEKAREEFAAERSLPWGNDVVLAMALLDLKAGNAQRVLDQVSMPDLQRVLSPQRRAEALELTGEASLRLGRVEEAASFLEEALKLGAARQARFASQRESSGAATSVLGERIGLHSLALYAEAQARLADGLEAARAIERWQLRSLRSAADADIDKADVLAWARSYELGLVTWVVGADSSVVAHVAPDGSALAAPIAHGRREIEAAVRRLTEAATSGDSASVSRLMGEIRSAILPEPIAALITSLESPRPGRLLFLLHGPLEELPVELFETDERLVAVALPGLPERAPGDAVREGDLAAWSLLGGPVDAMGRPLLLGAREELASIAALYRGRNGRPSGEPSVLAGENDEQGMRIGSRFDRAALAEALAGRRPLHVATHLKRGFGSRGGRLDDVGLELSGGDVICAREILDARPRLPLAVLSACDTAGGRFVDAEGLQGIARAFLDSGTRNLLVTLWPVEDGAARVFALEFHRALLAGNRPSEAAASARGALRAQGFGMADWAAFRLLGRD